VAVLVTPSSHPVTMTAQRVEQDNPVKEIS
jgi:hypothetical protein